MIIYCPPVNDLPCRAFVDPPALIRHLEEKPGDAGIQCKPVPKGKP